MKRPKLTNQQKGEIASNLAINKFMSYGYTIYKAVTDIEKVDFITRKVIGGRKKSPYYFEIQVKGCKYKYPLFKVPLHEYKLNSPDYYYVLVYFFNLDKPEFYLLTQAEVRKWRYKSRKKLHKKSNKFRESICVIKINEADKERYSFDNRIKQDIFKRINK